MIHFLKFIFWKGVHLQTINLLLTTSDVEIKIMIFWNQFTNYFEINIINYCDYFAFKQIFLLNFLEKSVSCFISGNIFFSLFLTPQIDYHWHSLSPIEMHLRENCPENH